jgi:hypothetical protein
VTITQNLKDIIDINLAILEVNFKNEKVEAEALKKIIGRIIMLHKAKQVLLTSFPLQCLN